MFRQNLFPLTALLFIGLGSAAVAAPPALPAAGQASAGVPLALHRAIYEMRLATARPGAGLGDARGTMAYTFNDSCDGWTVETRTDLKLYYYESGEVDTSWRFVTWESKDGKRYRFRTRNLRDGELVEELQGEAELPGGGKTGVVRFVKPEAQTQELPAGAMFPTQHTVALLKEAMDGRHHFTRTVFDGASEDSPYEISAAIGRRAESSETAKGLPPNAPKDLFALPSWPMRLAFFANKSTEALPDYELGIRYYANGVADDVLQDFGDFTVRAKLKSIERLPKPNC